MLVVMGLNLVNASTCADLNAVTSSGGVSFSLGQVTVVFVKGAYTYVQDATGTSLIYQNNYGLKAGDVVTGISGTAKSYNGLPELTSPTAKANLTITEGAAPSFPDANAIPTTADVNKLLWFRDVNMGAQSFPSNSADNRTGSFLDGAVDFRNAWKEAYQFDSAMTYDILGCVAIYKGAIQVYAAQILQHTEDLHSSITVGVQKPSEWNGLYLHYWNTSLGSTNWPGEAVAVDSLGWAYFTFPNDTAINYIWNSGDGTQTVNLTTNRSVCQRLLPPQPHISNSQYTALEVECGALDQPTDTVTPQPVDTVTPLPISSFNVEFQANNWESLYLYAWTDTGEPLGGWPGIEVQRDSLGWAYYTFNLESVNYIWNDYNNHKQTKNLATTESKCERVGSLLDDTQYNAVYDVEAVACGSAWPSDTVTPTPIDTITPTPVDTTGHDTIPLPGTEITLGFGNAFAWGMVYLYAWDDYQNPLLGEWPGTQVYPDSSQWCYYTFRNKESVHYIWNNGLTSEAAARQTQDLTANASVCQAVDPFATNYPFGVVEIECEANPDFVFDLSFEQALAVGALADITNPSYYTYRTTGVVSNVLTSPENVDRYKNCDFFITNPTNPNDHSIECFRTRWLHNEAMSSTNMPAVGDTVTIVGSLQYYQGRTVEFNRGYIESIARQVTPDTIPQEPITVKLLASSVREVYDCNYVNLYAWCTDASGSYVGEPPLGGWPGTGVPLDSATGWYTYTFDPAIQDVNIIWSRWCDGGYRQTQDIMHVTSDRCYRLMQDSTGVIAVGADCSIVEPILPDTVAPVDPTHNQSLVVKLQAVTIPETWQQVRIYSWSPGVDPAVSTDYGLLLTEDSLGWYSYTFQNVDTVYFLFNNGSWGSYNQTLDAEIYRIDNGKDFVQRCLTLGDPTYTERHYYQLWDVDCVHPDTIPIVPVDTNMTHKVYIYDNITRVAYDSIEVVHGQNVLLLTSNLPTYEGYHFVFWEVGGAYCDGFIGNVTSDMYAQAKFYIDLPEELPANPITVRIDPQSVPESWENIYIYSWTEGAMEEQWPGAVMTRDAAGWLTYTFPAGVQNIDFLIDNGNGNTGNQTVDVDDVNSNYCFRIANPLDTNGLYMVYPTECPVQPQPEGITVRLTKEDTYGGWYGTYYVYAWQTIDSVDIPILGEWPGVEMNYDEQTNRYSYTFDEQYHNVNIVFSTDQGVQTDDIRGITEDACFQVGPGMGWLNGMYVHNYVQVSCDQSIQYHLVYFYGINGDFLAVVRVADGESAEAPVVPEVTGYTFMGWNQDFSHVTGQMNVYAVYQYNGASGDGITVRLLPTNGYGWENIYLYAWTNTGEPLGSWPGTLIPKDSTGWHAYTFTEDTLVNIVWNDGITGQGYTHQTQDIKNLGASACYRLYGKDSIGFTTALTMDCDANPADYHTIAYMDVDFDNQLLLIGQVAHGATFEYSPTIPQHEGIVFQCWANAVTGETFDTNAPITEDLLIDEVYNHVYYWAYLVDWDGTIIASGQFAHGISITNINEFSGYCYREGYEFIGWSDSLQNITSARISVAQYKPLSAGNYTITYSGKDGEFLDTQNIDLNVPVPATIDGYMFVGWQVVGGSLEQGIQVQATYEPIGGSGAPATEGEQAGPRKIIRDNNIYILTSDGKVYTSDGKLVENK